MSWNFCGLLRPAINSSRLSIGICLTGLLNASPESMYFIGNSFTWDAQPNRVSTETLFPNGIKPDIGWSIYSGKSLTYIVENPDKSVAEGQPGPEDYFPDPNYSGNYETEFAAQHWEAVSMQPHTYNGGVFMETEIAAANTIIAKALAKQTSQNTVFYIYGPWAFKEGPDKDSGRTYSQNWLSGYSQNQINNGVLPNIRQAFRPLFWDPLINANPSVTIRWIPVGEVVYRLDQELQKGTIPGLSGAWDLFDTPGVHLHDPNPNDGFEGRYVAHITTLCTIWGSEPSAFQTGFESDLDPDFKALVDSLVWETVLELYPDISACEPDGNLIRHPGLPGDLLKSSRYNVAARLGPDDEFRPSAVFEYATQFGEDPVLDDPFNISNANNREALADVSHWTSVSYGYNGHPLEFEISLSSEEAITSCELYPGRYQIPVTVENGKARLSLYAPNRYLYLVINEDRENPLFLFVDPLEENPPQENDEGVLYFGPGIHDLGMNFPFPEDKDTIYLALGSYVTGSILAENRSDISVRGRGILSGTGYGLDSEVNAAVHFKGSGTNQWIEGITSLRPLKFHVISRGTLHTQNIKCLSYNNTTDGVVAGTDSVTEHSFFKVNDDVIKLYYDNQTVRDLVVYHQTNSPVFEFGWAGQSSQNSLVERIDIVQDDTVGSPADGQAILGWAHNNNAGGEQKGHVFDDIRAENGKKSLMHLNIDNALGFVDITCRNWNIASTEDSSDLYAVAPGSIKIAFENVLVNQQPLDATEFENVGNSDLQLSFSPLDSGSRPLITTQPQSALVEIGDSLELAIESEGVGALDYQWFKDGKPLPGASSSSLNLQNLETAAAGEYEVQVSNPFGTTTSKVALVTFTPVEQSINLTPITDRSIEEGPVSLQAFADSSLPVQFEIISGPATLDGNELSFTASGKIVLRATQPGGSVWLPADTVESSFTVYSVFDTWRLEELGNWKDAGTAANLADPDFDHIPNLFEYYLGTSPVAYDTIRIMQPMPPDSAYKFESTQSTNSMEGLEVVFQTSQDLLLWTELTSENLVVTEMENGDRQFHIQTKGLELPYFIRLSVSPL
jgi:hypothetical protein